MLEKLNWDSDFFGFGVGRTEMANAIQMGCNALKRTMLKDGYRLIYVFDTASSDPNGSSHSEEKKQLIRQCNLLHIDTKVIFKRLWSRNELGKPSPEISIYQEGKPSSALYSLALQSGVYSRFRCDENFPSGSFEKMYQLWMDNSLEGNMADRVLVARDEKQQEIGMLTLSFKKDTGSIGLFAVDQQARGKSIGKKLMQAALWHCEEKGIASLEVPTQLNNTGACSFYRKAGFSEFSVTQIFHLWNLT